MDILREQGAAALTARALAARADTSPAALYELFGDKAGVMGHLRLRGFRLLAEALSGRPETPDPLADLWALTAEYRRFVRRQPALAIVMFTPSPSGTVATPEELAAAAAVGGLIGGHVRRCVASGRLVGDAADTASILEALLQGLAFAEAAGRLGSSTESVERRWRLAVASSLNGLGARAVDPGGRRPSPQ